MDDPTDPSLPTFLVIGAMKGGTTSLHRYLRAHPQVFMPEHKEVEFFSEERNWQRGLDWYRGLFEPGRTIAARGEASTGYTKLPRFPEAAGRIASVLPDVRLVYLVREPVARMRSHYVHNVLRGLERRPIAEALLSGEHYLPVSRYHEQLRRYRDVLPDEQLLIVASEDLRDQRAETVARIFTFLGVDPDLLPADLDAEHHQSESRRALRAGARAVARSRTLDRLRAQAPAPLVALGRRFLARSDPLVDAEIDDDLRTRLLDELHEDLRALGGLLGGLPESWSAPGR